MSMDALTWFGLFAVSAMLLTYSMEERSHWFVLGFAAALLGRSTDFFKALGRSAWSKRCGRGLRSSGGARGEEPRKTAAKRLSSHVEMSQSAQFVIFAHFRPALNRTQESPDVHPD